VDFSLLGSTINFTRSFQQFANVANRLYLFD
jgi:hypothetical protein